jgi:hypothetical protein
LEVAALFKKLTVKDDSVTVCWGSNFRKKFKVPQDAPSLLAAAQKSQMHLAAAHKKKAQLSSRSKILG